MILAGVALGKLIEGVVVVVMLTVGQVLFKKAASIVGAGQAPMEFIVALLQTGAFWLAMVIYGLATLLWIHMLTKYNLSTTHGLLALSYIAVPVIGMLWLGEPFKVSVVIAIGFILVGVGILVSTG